jgi:uncharacterized membrane protein YphA (DoxX/SURF4 family)
VKAKKIVYWVTTVLVAFAFLMGGVYDFMSPPEVIEIFNKLGYPAYFGKLIGVWKVLGAIAIVLPKFPRLKEWAYAGIVLDLTGASISHAAVGDGVSEIITPLVLCLLAGVSWAFRPQSRVLGTLPTTP